MRHPRDYLEQEAISTLGPEGQRARGGDGANRTQGHQGKVEPQRGRGVLPPPPSLSPHWLNPVEQLTQEPGKTACKGQLT